jgi:hypothetical protein
MPQQEWQRQADTHVKAFRREQQIAKLTPMVPEELRPYLRDHIVLWTMARHNIPFTRENYIDLNWNGEVPEEWDAECEMQIPRPLQLPEYRNEEDEF